jgi:2,3-dihydroxybenzoate decarboxylase
MQRREFLRSAALVAGANATAVLANAAANNPALETTATTSVGAKPVGKIALEEHFMMPEFVEYFAETYPNISPEIAKLGLAALLVLMRGVSQSWIRTRSIL